MTAGSVRTTGTRRRVLGATLVLALLAGAPGSAETRVLPMATGDVTGVYFPAGIALCRVVNAQRRIHGLRCAAVLSQGSGANIALLRSGAVDFALVQSDTQNAAWRGAAPFGEQGAFEALRSVMALYPEPLTLVTGQESGIGGLADLLGRRVSVGEPASGQRAMIEELMDRLGWRASAFARMLELGPAAAVEALCAGEIDAFFYAAGQPALAIREATAGCAAGIAPVAGPAVDALVAANPFYRAVEIPAGVYMGVGAPTPTFAVAATLVTRAELPAGEVETVTGAILDNLADLAGFNAPLAALTAATLPGEGLTAPLHSGAEAALRERGLIE